MDNDFPFDESQLDAIEGISTRAVCLSDWRGGHRQNDHDQSHCRSSFSTLDVFDSVNMQTYWKSGTPPDADDDYEAPKAFVPSVAMCAYTGRATQMIKKNFPRDWHGNIMTIHRMLGFVPEFEEVWDDESCGYKKKMKFVPDLHGGFSAAVGSYHYRRSRYARNRLVGATVGGV